MTISKTKAEAVMLELRPLIEDALKRNGMDAKFAWKYGAWFELKVTSSEVAEGENGVNLSSPEAQYFTKFGFNAYDLSFRPTPLEAPLGTLFDNRGELYAFAGIAAKRKKYPIYAIRVADGVGTFFPEGAVAMINKAAASAAV